MCERKSKSSQGTSVREDHKPGVENDLSTSYGELDVDRRKSGPD